MNKTECCDTSLIAVDGTSIQNQLDDIYSGDNSDESSNTSFNLAITDDGDSSVHEAMIIKTLHNVHQCVKLQHKVQPDTTIDLVSSDAEDSPEVQLQPESADDISWAEYNMALDRDMFNDVCMALLKPHTFVSHIAGFCDHDLSCAGAVVAERGQ